MAGEPLDWDLPENYRSLIPVLGRQRTFEVAALVNATQAPPSHSGVRSPGRRGRGRQGCIYVPMKLRANDSQQIVRLLGRQDAARMVEVFAGSMVWFPGLDARVRRRRDEAIVRMAADGWRRPVVAWSFDVSERTVNSIAGPRSRPAVLRAIEGGTI